MKLYLVKEEFEVESGNRDYEYKRRFKKGAKILHVDEGQFKWWFQTVFERIDEESMLPFTDNLIQLPYEFTKDSNELKEVSSYNHRNQLTELVR